MKTKNTFSIIVVLLLGWVLALTGHTSYAAENLIWKRTDLLKRTLAQALDLDQQQLCLELDRYRCFDYVHQYSLGGHNAEDLGQFQGQPGPSITSAVAFERVMLISCQNRVEQDQLIADPKGRYFSHLDLTAKVKDLSEQSITLQAQDLYQRFFQRLPNPQEEEILLNMTRNPILQELPVSRLAQLLCFSVGSQAEFLFF